MRISSSRSAAVGFLALVLISANDIRRPAPDALTGRVPLRSVCQCAVPAARLAPSNE
jgi:hypothetical protein